MSKGEDYAKIELATFRVTNNFMKPKDLKTTLQIVQANNKSFEAKWDDWFSQR